MVTAVIDADGVIFDFLTPFKEIASNITHREITEVNNDWSLSSRYALTNCEVKKVFNILNENGLWSGFPLLEGADKALKKLIKTGADIYVVSSMPVEQVSNRIKALRRYKISLPVIALGVGSSKKDIYRKLKPDYVIDDYCKHLDEAKEANVKERFLINSSIHNEDRSSATKEFKSLVDSVNFMIGK